MRPRIVLGGSLAQKPRRGGHTWVFLQYLLGFERLGWEVLFLDRLDPDMGDAGPGLAYTRRVFEGFGLLDRYSVFGGDGKALAGRSRAEVLDFVRSSTVFLNVMGFIDDADLLGAAPLLTFLDIDPGFGQIWCETGLHDPFAGHHRFVTIGERIGEPGCDVPTCGLDWITTPQPVVLDQWPVVPATGIAFTSVASWRGSMGPLEFRGRRLGLRVHEFRRFLDLPRRCGHPFELALDIHDDETEDLERLREAGWTLVDPVGAAGDPRSYQAFIQGSGAELMVAKNLYVELRPGWFSDRSICYLASGRPVLAQDTGLPDRLPTGLGLVTFETLEDACAGADAIVRERARHSRAARELAEAYFDSDWVLPRLVEAVTSSSPVAGAVSS